MPKRDMDMCVISTFVDEAENMLDLTGYSVQIVYR